MGMCRRVCCAGAVYMAPEVFQREYGLEADMWSLGMMLYQCMTCRFPFWPSLQACRDQSLDEVARAVILDDIELNFGPWLEMSEEVCCCSALCHASLHCVRVVLSLFTQLCQCLRLVVTLHG